MGEIEEKNIGYYKVQEILGENPYNNEIRDMAWRNYLNKYHKSFLGFTL